MIDCCKVSCTRPDHRSRLIFDLDSSVVTVFGRQQKAEVGYNPRYRGKRSYNPLLCLEANSSYLWDTELRPGNAGTWDGSVELLASCFINVPSDIRHLRVRAEAGFGFNPVLEILEARAVQYAVVARLSQAFKPLLPGRSVYRGLQHSCVGRGSRRPCFVAIKNAWTRRSGSSLPRRACPKTFGFVNDFCEEQGIAILFARQSGTYRLTPLRPALRQSERDLAYRTRWSGSRDLVVSVRPVRTPLASPQFPQGLHVSRPSLCASNASASVLIRAPRCRGWFRRLPRSRQDP
jgi:hypothetical protein